MTDADGCDEILGRSVGRARAFLFFLVVWVVGLIGAAPVQARERPSRGMTDLGRAVIVVPPGASAREGAAVQMLVDEVRKRSGIDLEVGAPKRGEGRPSLIVGTRQGLKPFASVSDILARCPSAPESYAICPLAGGADVAVVGHDERGVLFGVGRLLRELRMGPGRVALPADFKISTSPKVAIRGHQLGYRPKTNSYDGWDLPQWDQYVRDLAVFGTNTVELVPSRTDDDETSPHFPRPPLEMLVGMSRLLDRYGLDVSLWQPAMGTDYGKPETVAASLKEWGDTFRLMPRLDAVFVPGGDPGKTEPKVLFAFLEKAAKVLRETHPRAGLWVSPQGFSQVWLDEFLGLVANEPAWLTGVVHGPQVRVTPPELRKAVPARYPIRSYPDITHSRQCQHPVPDWDLAFALTEGREAINPRPMAQAALLRAYLPDTVGFVSYSEGCNDDVNKFVWSGLAWDPSADVLQTLREYSRYFLGESYADPFAQSLLALERNWGGPLLTNSGVETTLHQVRNLERQAGPAVAQNWRFQQALYRAYYDAYIRDRLIEESALEARAMGSLRDVARLGPDLAIRCATATLESALTNPVSVQRRARVFALGEALFQSIHMQLDVAHYKAIEAERGANLDTIDVPLNNRVWLEGRFAEVRALKTTAERTKALQTLLDRTNPGPGGFYDALGDPAQRPHLVQEPGFAKDPFLARTPFHGFALRDDWPTAWRRFASTLYDAPLLVHYEGLDPEASYVVRVVYAGDNFGAKMRLEAEGAEIHPWLTKPNPVRPVEFDLPRTTTQGGRLTLSWTQEPGRGGNGRGCQVAEVWLVRK